MARSAGLDIKPEKTQATANEHVYQLGGSRLTMTPSCWDTASYDSMMSTWKLTPAVSDEPTDYPLHELLTPTVTVLQKANKQISAALKAHPTEPAAHEQAAFLLGVFGIRENARCFSDLRPILCRMTAHLAFAGQLRRGSAPSVSGEWARVLYDLHAGRPKDALAKIAKIDDSGDSGRWKRAVTLLIKGDWRRTSDLADPSLVEAIAHARALQIHRDNPVMMEFVKTRKDLQGIPEWTRLLAGPGKSVDDGHLVMRSGVAMEFYEMRAIFPVGENPSAKKLGAILSTESPHSLVGQNGPRVIADGDWAAYFRRHFFANAADTARFATVLWGDLESAAEWEKAMLPLCRAMPDHELVEPLLSIRPRDYQSTLKTCAAYILKHPEQVPMGLWFNYRFGWLDISPDTQMPDQTPWFRTVSPPGTAHSPVHRIRFSGIQGSDWVEHIKSLHEIDPWNSELCYELAENTGNSAESVKAAWGEICEYSVRPITQTLESPHLSLDQRIEVLRGYIKLDPEAGLELGAALAVFGKPDEAIKAFETAFESASDRVAFSNRSQWMIYYYKSHGDPTQARKIADANATVYSARGLESAFSLAVSEKDSARAADLAEKIRDRYGNPVFGLIAAWSVDGDQSALKKVFPNGMKSVGVGDFPAGQRQKGLRLDQQSLVMTLNGLRANDVLLAVDGKRIETYHQYLLVMSSGLDPKTTFIIKRGKKIIEVPCVLPNRRLETDLLPYE